MRKKDWSKMTAIYLGITIFTALLGAVYECFSHGVYSYYMIYAFAVPLVLGVLPGFIFTVTLRIVRIPKHAVLLWNAGAAALTVGSLFQGVLEIYGTTNRLSVLYLEAGVILLFASLASILIPGILRSLQVSSRRP